MKETSDSSYGRSTIKKHILEKKLGKQEMALKIIFGNGVSITNLKSINLLIYLNTMPFFFWVSKFLPNTTHSYIVFLQL